MRMKTISMHINIMINIFILLFGNITLQYVKCLFGELFTFFFLSSKLSTISLVIGTSHFIIHLYYIKII